MDVLASEISVEFPDGRKFPMNCDIGTIAYLAQKGVNLLLGGNLAGSFIEILSAFVGTVRYTGQGMVLTLPEGFTPEHVATLKANRMMPMITQVGKVIERDLKDTEAKPTENPQTANES